jgi:hypothetical protein
VSDLETKLDGNGLSCFSKTTFWPCNCLTDWPNVSMSWSNVSLLSQDVNATKSGDQSIPSKSKIGSPALCAVRQLRRGCAVPNGATGDSDAGVECGQ